MPQGYSEERKDNKFKCDGRNIAWFGPQLIVFHSMKTGKCYLGWLNAGIVEHINIDWNMTVSIFEYPAMWDGIWTAKCWTSLIKSMRQSIWCSSKHMGNSLTVCQTFERIQCSISKSVLARRKKDSTILNSNKKLLNNLNCVRNFLYVLIVWHAIQSSKIQTRGIDAALIS